MINGAVILITGASSGFGCLAAARLAAAGHTVYATMRDVNSQGPLMAEARKRNAQLKILRLDVTDKRSITDVINSIQEEHGQLHVLVNNAGFGMGGFFEDLEESEIREQFETNFFGAQEVTRQALPLMRQTAATGERRGRIINISSVQGRLAAPGLGAYASSKYALEGFSEGLSFELHPFGIDVVLIEPGAYATEIFTTKRRIGRRATSSESPYRPLADHMLALVDKRAATGRKVGDPEDVASLIEKVIGLEEA
ncbi:MAG: SDR family NAD(P)-dependent oxidoreductase, partial [Candidatus Marinimicrobia bacterium]|nr:SDR family NAD(P)-dependent oxidoreductase [Candidatus Neomarinimicrobiota bacterium]